MPKYLSKRPTHWRRQGTHQGRRLEASGRGRGVAKVWGGSRFEFGNESKTDAFVLVDLPDSVSATAVALTVGASGSVRLKTTVLITPEEVDQAVKKTINYRAPGAG